MSKITGIILAASHYEAHGAEGLKADLSQWCTAPDSLQQWAITRQVEWYLSRILVKNLLSTRSGEFRLQVNSDRGYPELVEKKTGTTTSQFTSWSHTQGFVVAGLSETPFGIDVEHSERSMESVLSRIACREEISLYQKRPLRIGKVIIDRAVALWCGKEAAAKASGLGMLWGLKNFRLGPVNEHALAPVTIERSGPRHYADPAVRFWLEGPYLVALCAERAQLSSLPKKSCYAI